MYNKKCFTYDSEYILGNISAGESVYVPVVNFLFFAKTDSVGSLFLLPCTVVFPELEKLIQEHGEDIAEQFIEVTVLKANKIRIIVDDLSEKYSFPQYHKSLLRCLNLNHVLSTGEIQYVNLDQGRVPEKVNEDVCQQDPELPQYKRDRIGTYSTEELNNFLDESVKKEEYEISAPIRDELRRREVRIQ